MSIKLDAFDEVPGRKVARVATRKHAPRRWRTLNTIACERIARRRAQALLDDDKIVDAVPWLKYANRMMVLNNVSRLVRAHGVP